MPTLFRTSILVSLLMHIVVFSIFIFQISIAPVPFKPSFIFLGSILHQQDISKHVLEKELSDQAFSKKNFLYTQREVSSSPFFDPIRQKPALYYDNIKTDEKVIIKSFFVVEENSKKKKIKPLVDLKNMGINEKTTPYRSLRFLTR
ncbi:hypothetical protein MNBD_UNCLBAC01-1957 [hydrothermal vent metagenome]|uniref:Uncharacterized protein n=1 Tax=hydrothermal vent metagenome TaxID=652676 RepID=A0A3B1DUB3_9ZZZZ